MGDRCSRMRICINRLSNGGSRGCTNESSEPRCEVDWTMAVMGKADLHGGPATTSHRRLHSVGHISAGLGGGVQQLWSATVDTNG